MKKRLISMLLICVMVIGLMVGCGKKDTSSSTGNDTNTETDTTTDKTIVTKTVEENWSDMTWEEVLAEAEGQTVNWYMWGGNANVNSFVDDVIAKKAAENGINLNRVGVTSISEAINKVLGEKTAGKDTDGEVDLIWINGANFMTMKQADVLFGPWSEEIENAALVNWEEPTIKYDMGYEVGGYESPWGCAQMQFIYESMDYNIDELPHNFTELLEWCKSNPGRFTYNALPDFVGTRFIKQVLYELTGGYEQYMRDDITKEEFEEMSADLWEYLEELSPYLWREGKVYPKSVSELDKLFSNKEVDFSMTLNAGGILSAIDAGTYTETSKVYTTDTSIGDVNYVAIPYNSSAKAAAMVIANIILEPSTQSQSITDINYRPVLDNTTLSDDQIKLITNAFGILPTGTYVEEDELIGNRVPEVSGYLNTYLEELWEEKIGTN